jgi:acetyl esterase/lipase
MCPAGRRAGIALVALAIACGTLHAAPAGPLSAIREGFGADGPFEVRVDTVPARFALHRTVWVYRPAVEDTVFPVVFFFAGFWAWHPSHYDPLLRHLASRGHCVIFPSYFMLQFPFQNRTFHVLYMGALTAARDHAAHIDTSRVGFVGHSFGASAVPPLVYRLLSRRGWGAAGTFMYLMSPFYLFALPPKALAAFPQQVKLVVQVVGSRIILAQVEAVFSD